MISAGTTTNIDLGPWVLQKIEGISRPALGTENFNFSFTHKVSKSIDRPCSLSSTFETVGHASATVDLNPGPAWSPLLGTTTCWCSAEQADGKPGRISVAMVLPQPQLPQSVHDVTIDNTLSHPIDTQHSWTYPDSDAAALSGRSSRNQSSTPKRRAWRSSRSGPVRRSPARRHAAEAQADPSEEFHAARPGEHAQLFTLVELLPSVMPPSL